jgi:hypothetical protein
MTSISLFENHFSTKPIKNIPLDEFLRGIQFGEWQTLTEKVRSLPLKEDRDNLKKTVPCVTISGVFGQRKETGLIKHSGFICIDIDTEFDREAILKDPYTYAMFDSVSKRGVAVLVKINPEKQKPSFAWLQRYYYNTYGITIDSAPQNVASLRCCSYDPNLFINVNAKQSGTHVEKLPKIVALPLVLEDQQISDLVNSVVAKGADLAQDYADYVLISFSFANGMGETGRYLFHKIASVNHKYNQKQADKQYDIALKREGASGKKTTIGTFYHYAKMAGVPLPDNKSKEFVGIAAIAKKSGRSSADVEHQLVTIHGTSPSLASKIATEVFQREDITLKTLAADPEHLIESLIQYLSVQYPLRRNGITFKIEHSLPPHRPLSEEDINDMYLSSRAAFNSPQVTKDLIQAIIFSGRTPTYNPFDAFYSQHASHQTTGHIEAIIDSIATTTPMARQFIRKWLIAIHAAIDGHPVRLMLVFTGPQYNGKTEFFRRLLPTELKAYYAESKLDRGKDDEILMCQKLIIMDDEMGGKSKQDEKRLKELTSRETFSLRAPYRRDNMDYKRLSILCGTSNPTEIMNDPTGNTRILPVRVDSINFPAINAIDRTALFMECHNAYKSGESWQLTAEEVAPLNALSLDFSSIAFERELVFQFFDIPSSRDRADWLTATEIKNEIESNSKQQIKNMTRFGIELKNIFGEPRQKKLDGVHKGRCYPVKRIHSGVTSGQGNTPMGNMGITDNYTDNQEIPF